eukprot:1189154-Prorocentrum_minimum.AAC.3
MHSAPRRIYPLHRENLPMLPATDWSIVRIYPLHRENIPMLPATDWSIVRIYPLHRENIPARRPARRGWRAAARGRWAR